MAGDESAPPSEAGAALGSSASKAFLSSTLAFIPAIEQSFAVAEHSASGKHKGMIGRSQVTVTVAPSLLNEGPNRVGGFMKPINGFEIVNPGRGSPHQEAIKMKQPNPVDQDN